MGPLRKEILRELSASFPQALSGETLARKLKVSRVAVWKEVQALRELGFPVESSRRGYAFRELPDSLFGEYLEVLLEGTFPSLRVVSFPELPSTNTEAKKLAQEGYPEGTLVVTDQQTEGRGRLKRKWFSEQGKSLTFSLLLRPLLPPELSPPLGLLVALTLSWALEELGFAPHLKWPNDLYLGEKKVAGVLLESASEMDQLEWVVVGVGVNVKEQEFPPELQSRATSLFLVGKREIPRFQVLRGFLTLFAREYPRLVEAKTFAPWIKSYLERFPLLGKVVEVIGGEKRFLGVVQSVDERGALWVEREGQKEALQFGEISLASFVNQ